MLVDNFDLILPFAPAVDDGDTFIYTELLDRSKRAGNNGRRLLKTFHHRSQKELTEQMPDIRRYCDMLKVRACTRLAPRSAKKVGKEMGRLVMQAITDENWWGLKSQYGSACGRTSPNEKLWLFDVDVIGEQSEALRGWLAADGLLVAIIPSKKGQHFIAKPHRPDLYLWDATTISLHKDNPTNLYIPHDAP
jgi:hypothetical protein